MSAVLYGVGVGPGDSKLLTLKALQVIESCDMLVIPVSDKEFSNPVYEEENKRSLDIYLEKSVAYQIVLAEVPSIQSYAKLYLPMPMIKDKERLKKVHDLSANVIAEHLEKGKKLAFLTLGDPSIYSTYLYMHERILKKGYQTEIIPGIPSFCAAAAKANISLAKNKEEIHIIPASYQAEEMLSLSGTKILMKSGKKITEIKKILKEKQLPFTMVENCGMKNENIYTLADEIPDESSYYSLIMIKEEK